MKSFIASAFLCIGPLAAATSAAAAAASSAAGRWEGAIEVPGAKLGIAVSLAVAGVDSWTGTIDIPAQGLRDYALTRVSVKDAAVSFALPNVPGDPTFTGTLATEAGTITGSLAQGELAFPFQLARAQAAAANASAEEEPISAGVPVTAIVGSWLGTLELGHNIRLRLALNVVRKDGQPVATVDSIDQGVKGLPVSRVTEIDNGVRLELQVIGAVFEGKYRAAGAELAGTWTQGGQTTPLVFQRQEKPFSVARPQEPRKPYLYREEELTFRNERANITLAGTLTLPASAGPHAAVVLISGSGPQDRDETVMGHKPFLILAHHLTRAGIAVLRYDDRGVARSQGNFGLATHVDFAADARAAFEFLQSRPETDPRRIGLLGHSEGSVHAPLAAAEASDVAFIVFLAGVGVPMRELLERQTTDVLKSQGLEHTPSPEERALEDAIFERMRTLPDHAETPAFIRAKARESYALMPDTLKKALGISEAIFESRVQMMLSPWFIRLAVYDPEPALIQVKCPVLALNGDKDVQVAADDNLAGIKAALEAGGNRDVTVQKFPGLNHLFQHCTTGAVGEYSEIEETMSTEVLATVIGWISEKTHTTSL